MKIAINLLQETQQIQARLRRMGLLLQTGSIVILVAYGIFVFLVISYSFWSNLQADRLSDDISKKKAVIEAMRPLEAKLIFVKQKLSFIETIVNEGGVRSDMVTEFYKEFSGEVKLSHLAITKGADALSLTVTTDDVFSLVEFLDHLISFAEENDFTRIAGDTFTRLGDGSYQLELRLYFTK